MINMSYIQEKINMAEREEILKKHPYKIWQGISDKKWHTYLPDQRGRIPRKRNTRDELEDVIVKFYKSKIESDDQNDDPNSIKSKTFEQCYWNWRKVQDELIDSPNTPVKYNTDYQRFFECTDFSLKEMRTITSEDVQVFIKHKIKELKLCKSATKSLFGYIRRVFYSARINKVIDDNPIDLLEAKNFYKYCTQSKRSTKEQIISDTDIAKLNEKYDHDTKEKPNYIPLFAVEFASLTAMRVGEISALKWEDISDIEITINKSEKYNRQTKEYYIDLTKNRKERKFPITDGIAKLLRRIKFIEIQYGYLCEWVFADANGRIHAPVISSCMKNKCRQIKIEEKGIHAWRKTVNSKMRESGVPSTVAGSLLGHSAQVNERYYTYDVSNIDSKKKIIEDVNKKVKEYA